jgi:hypothetical protein
VWEGIRPLYCKIVGRETQEIEEYVQGGCVEIVEVGRPLMV